jgi:hypothetical protein
MSKDRIKMENSWIPFDPRLVALQKIKWLMVTVNNKDLFNSESEYAKSMNFHMSPLELAKLMETIAYEIKMQTKTDEIATNSEEGR